MPSLMPGLFPRSLLCLSVLLAVGLTVAASPAPWHMWEASDEANPAVIDHASWQAFLDSAVVRDQEQRINLVRYGSLTEQQYQLLVDYLAYVQGIDPRDYKRAEQMAYWINLYNALTVQLVLDHPGKTSIRDMGKGWFSLGPWKDRLAVVAGQPLTLDDIEHRILRPLWQDRRIHYAVNCASIGCPELAASAYSGVNLDAMLSAAELTYIRHPRGAVFNADGELRLSSLFDWYLQDFALDEQGLIEYLADHAVDEVATRLRAYQGRPDYHYDWALNSTE